MPTTYTIPNEWITHLGEDRTSRLISEGLAYFYPEVRMAELNGDILLCPPDSVPEYVAVELMRVVKAFVRGYYLGAIGVTDASQTK